MTMIPITRPNRRTSTNQWPDPRSERCSNHFRRGSEGVYPQDLVKRSPTTSVRSCLIHSKEGKLSTLEGASKAGGSCSRVRTGGRHEENYAVDSVDDVSAATSRRVALAQDGVSKICNTDCRGTDRDDQLTGTSKANAIEGRNGADQIEGNGAKDTLNGNLGADAIYGGNGEDKLYGGGNDDYMQGGIKRDYISTGSGDDVIAAKDGFRTKHTAAATSIASTSTASTCCTGVRGS